MESEALSLLVLGFLALTAITGATRYPPTKCQELELQKICRSMINEDMSLLPGLVRLAFHDCVGNGGCDGCIDITKADNAGLKKYADTLEVSYGAFGLRDVVSRADFWILCSMVAIGEGHKISGKDTELPPPLTMRYGRRNCDDVSPYAFVPEDEYPSPHGNYNETTGYFADQFRLTERETIALLGAHTLGRARRDNSGFENPWVANEFALDNQFYKDIISPEITWIQVNDSLNDGDPNYQWVHKSTEDFLMFSSDMCLAKDVQADENGRVNTSMTQMPNSPGHSTVKEYAHDNSLWLAEFSLAYTKMVEKTTEEASLTSAILDRDYIDYECVGYRESIAGAAGTTTCSYAFILFLTLSISLH